MKERAVEKAIKKAKLTAYTRWTKAALISKIDQQASTLNELQNHQALLDHPWLKVLSCQFGPRRS